MLGDLLEFFAIAFGGVAALILALGLALGLPLWIWGDYAVEDIKANAADTWKRQGFEIIGYEGYELTLVGRPGGCVWYTLRAHDEPITRYTGCLSRWRGEYHAYSVRALNAVQTPNK